MRPSCLLLGTNICAEVSVRPEEPENAETGLVILKKRVVGLSEAVLARFLTRARRVAGLKGNVNVLITSSREIQSLNRRFRGKNKATDVLSFPALESAGNAFAGDIAISADVAAQGARRFGHKTADEIKILALHGVLHLAGYDHENDKGEMARKEQQLRKKLGLPLGLIERVAGGRAGPQRRPR